MDHNAAAALKRFAAETALNDADSEQHRAAQKRLDAALVNATPAPAEVADESAEVEAAALPRARRR